MIHKQIKVVWEDDGRTNVKTGVQIDEDEYFIKIEITETSGKTIKRINKKNITSITEVTV